MAKEFQKNISLEMSGSVSTVSVFKSSVLEASGLNKDNLSFVILKDTLSSITQNKLLLNYIFSYWANSNASRFLQSFQFVLIASRAYCVVALEENPNIVLSKIKYLFISIQSLIIFKRPKCTLGPLDRSSWLERQRNTSISLNIHLPFHRQNRRSLHPPPHPPFK
jgi:hypothetical protein